MFHFEGLKWYSHGRNIACLNFLRSLEVPIQFSAADGDALHPLRSPPKRFADWLITTQTIDGFKAFKSIYASTQNTFSIFNS
jgi:hypothetical protein